ncbi:MAG TPA: right-handed parallel beta-helix repeat-containing protein [Candidatus Deferrimicrobium sp.]|nr:right-handed parallel beta-helix repeat-containing protein [Candidatus Deferrimicrobium sp.]
MPKKLLVVGVGVIILITTGLFTASGIPPGERGRLEEPSLQSPAATFLVMSTADAGPGTLRQAILNANGSPGQDTIVFGIPGIGVQTISPLSQLPALTDPAGVIIDGTTQPGATCGSNPPSTASLLIQIKGNMAGAAHGFWVASSNNTIKGLIINDFQQNGICIEGGVYNMWASYNIVTCCFIGTDPTGTLDQGNGTNLLNLWAGVMIKNVAGGFAFDNFVEYSLISGNYAEGVAIMGPVQSGDVYNNHVSDNYIGTDISGTSGLGNDHEGVCLTEGTHDNHVFRNVSSGNGYDGVGIQGFNNMGFGPPIQTRKNNVWDNLIGLTVTMTSLPNAFHGVAVGEYGPTQWGCADSNRIGPNNRIATNGRDGVAVWEDGINDKNADWNLITQNSIYDNTELGIDLWNNGVTLNDPGDPDTGPNDEMNFPVITSAILVAGNTTITGTLDYPLPATTNVEVFKASYDPSGYGEGRTYLGFATPDPFGNWNLTVATLVLGDSVTATATDMNKSTSEFSGTVAVTRVEPDSCEFYKAGYVDFSPNGMPDFDQKQDQWTSPFNGMWSWCGPVALADCIWWFDSKFEPSPIDPRPFYPGPGNPAPNDGYPLVQYIGMPPPVWDDHDTNNAMPFIQALKPMCNTDVTVPGTLLSDLQTGFNNWLAAAGLSGKYSTYVVLGPEFQEIRDSIKSSQDVILLLGFYELIPVDPGCKWVGGHYVTAAGVCTTVTDICISDPYFDKNDAIGHPASVHNDASLVSGPHGTKHHDRYNLVPNATGCPSPATWMFTNYPNTWSQIGVFENQNPIGPMPPVSYSGGQIVVLLDAALIICPVVEQPDDTCEFYKKQYGDYAPFGVPDFDQKQNGWIGGPFNAWSFCGPVALADCFWWIDSRFELPGSPPPPAVSDNYPLVKDYTVVMGDDHSPNNVIPFVNLLAPAVNCLPGPVGNGTWLQDLYNGAAAWIAAAGLSTVDNRLKVKLIPSPSFDTIKTELRNSEDVILQLGFYEFHGPQYCRLGGHYITVAGVCTTDTRLCVSDPWFDENEGEPPAGSAHGSAVHNDAQFISGPHGQIQHDAYQALMNPLVPPPPTNPVLELADYPDGWSGISNFAMINETQPPLGYCNWTGGPIFTMVEWAVIVSPCCLVRGNVDDTYGPAGPIDVADLTYLVAYLFSGGGAPPCIEQGNVDGVFGPAGPIDVADLTYLVAYLFSGGAVPPACP